jgi:HD superfamily phosphohydrolase
MEIRDPIHGAITLSKDELLVVDSRPLQRLRRIKQLGFGEFAFPGATHNRFSHSLGAMFLAGVAFDKIFAHFSFSSEEAKKRLRKTVRLGALLHDVGHGPLSHASEKAMPLAKELNITGLPTSEKRASHEHYTLKIIVDGPLRQPIIESGVSPESVAALISSEISPKGNELEDAGCDFRPLLSQLVSSEMDVDRMDYLLRDSYYAGVTYGRYDLSWLLSNLTFHQDDQKLYLALHRRALHAFEDFLLSRYHMYLMVYLHHLSVIYEEMLVRHFEHEAKDFLFPAGVEEYLRYDDYMLYTYLAQSGQDLATRIHQNIPYRLLTDEQDPEGARRLDSVEDKLSQQGIPLIRSSSSGTLSHYWKPQGITKPKNPQIFVVDRNNMHPVVPLERSTELFSRYASKKVIERIYVPPEFLENARKLLRL